MPIQSQTLDVPLIALKQSWPTTAGLAGRLLTLNNAIAKRWIETDNGVRLRVEKRDGFTAYNGSVRDTDGTSSTKNVAGATLITSRGDQAVALSGTGILALNADKTHWYTPAYVCPTQTLTAKTVVNRGTIDEMPDSCTIGESTFNTWTSYNGTDYIGYYNIVSSNGTVVLDVSVIAAPVFTPVITSKCVADGTRFWLVCKPGNPGLAYMIYAFDTNGSLLGSDTVTIPQDGDYWDIVPDTAGANGFAFIQRSGAGPDWSVRHATFFSGAVHVSPATVNVGGCSTGRLAFISNNAPDNKYYAVTVDGAGPYTFNLYSIANSTLAITLVKSSAGHATLPVEISGWANSLAPFYTICFSFLDAGAFAPLNKTEIWTASSGALALASTKLSVTVVSRAFFMDDRYYVIAYYQSSPGTLKNTNNIQQSTFYLLDLDSSATYQICGEWDKGNSYADWQVITGLSKWFHLSSPVVRADGTIHTLLSFRARSSTTAAPIFVVEGRRGVAAFTGYNTLAVTQINTVGLKDYSFGAKARRAVKFANQTLLPGPRTTAFTGTPTNHGISLVPEMTAPVPAAAGSGLTPSAPYEVVCVVEWTNPNGERVRSIAGPPYAFSTGVGQRQVTYSGTMVQNDVGKDNLTIALYRTAFVNGVQSSQHYKVTDDLLPVYNTVGVATWTYTDALPDATAANNEILYTDKNFLDRYPCPAFSDGCEDALRAYVIGYDGAVWFSGTKAEGDEIWFNPAFRIVLNNDIPKAIAVFDQALVIWGETENVYVVAKDSLPANDGSGSVPNPQLLPLSHGATGPACVFSQGAMFPSTQGGLWCITRNFQDSFIGADVKEFIETAGPVVDIYQDSNQRVCCLTASGSFAVYDAVSKAWYTWTAMGTVNACGTVDGTLFISDSSAVYGQVAGAVSDNGFEIQTTVEVQLQLGGVRNFKRIWNMQFEGEYRGAHTLLVRGFFDDDNTNVVETYSFTPDPAEQYLYELPPAVEECSSITLEFSDSFPSGPSAGFALEMLSFEIGIERGLGRLSPTDQRKPSS